MGPIPETAQISRYTKLAEDRSCSEKLRHAAGLFAETLRHMYLENVEMAVQTGKQALELFREVDDQAGIASVLGTLIPIGIYQPQRDAAVEEALEEMEKFRRAGFREGEAKMQLTFSEVSNGCGHLHRETALQSATAARDFFRISRDKHHEAMALLSMASVHIRRPGDKVDKRSARDAAQGALEIYRELNDRKQEAMSLHLVGLTHFQYRSFEPGAFEVGVEAVQEALLIWQELGIKKYESVELETLAKFHTAENQLEEALPYAQEALELAWEMNLPNGGAVPAMRTLFGIHEAKNDSRRALNVAKDALWRFQEAEDARGEAAAWDAICQGHCLNDEFQEALNAAEESIALLRDFKYFTGEVKMIQRTACIYFSMQRFDEALVRAAECVERFHGMNDVESQAEAMHHLTQIQNGMGDSERAMETAMDERKTFQKAGHVPGEASSLLMICSAHMKKGEMEQAINTAREAARIFHSVDEKKGELMALQLHSELLMNHEKWDDALRVHDKAISLAMELKDKVAEATLTLHMVQSQAMLIGGSAKGEENQDPRTMKDFTRKFDACLALAEKAVGQARKLGNQKHIASTLCTLAQVHMLDRQLELMMQAAKEAQSIAKEIGDVAGEAHAIVITSEARARSGKLEEAKKLANSAMKLFQSVEDEGGEISARDLLQKIEEAMPTAQQKVAPVKVSPVTSFMLQKGDFQAAAPAQEEETQVAKPASRQGPRAESDSIKGKVSGVTMEILGLEEDLADDSPLMSSGLTSNSAVLLRNKLAEELPGISLPFTLVFDYPTIGSIADYIADQAGG